MIYDPQCISIGGAIIHQSVHPSIHIHPHLSIPPSIYSSIHLRILKVMEAAFFQSMEEGSAGESPYIGKGRFRPNEMAHEAFFNTKPIVVKQGQVNSWPKGAGATSGQAAAEGSHVKGFAGITSEQAKAIESMNRELEEKQKAIKSGNWILPFALRKFD